MSVEGVTYVVCPTTTSKRYKRVALMTRADGRKHCTGCGGQDGHQTPLWVRIEATRRQS